MWPLSRRLAALYVGTHEILANFCPYHLTHSKLKLLPSPLHPAIFPTLPARLTRMTTIRSLSSESLPSSSSRASHAPGDSNGGASGSAAVPLPSTPCWEFSQAWWILPSQVTLDHTVLRRARPIDPPRLRNPPYEHGEM